MNDKFLNLFFSSGSLNVDVTWEIGLSWLWYELVKALNHQYDKAISKAILHWVCLNCPFHCSSFFFFLSFLFFANFARATTLSNLWYDWKRNRSPMGQSDVILLFVHLFLHPRVFFIEVVSNYITRICTSQMWKSFSSADRRNIIANCKKRHVESRKRKRSLSLIGVGLMLPLNFGLVVFVVVMLKNLTKEVVLS